MRAAVVCASVLGLSCILGCASKPTAPADPARSALAASPPAKGDGPARHDFLYCGEWQTDRPGESMYLVRGGKVVWTHTIPDKEELDDCTMLSNGHIVFARKGYGASEIVPDLKAGQGGEIVWDYKADPKSEVHSVQPIGTDKVLIMQNGTPPRLMLIDKASGAIERSIEMEAKPQVHGQFRHVRMTAQGTFLVAHLNLGLVREYASDGKTVIWEVPAPSAWAAVRLKNGNTLISGNQHKYVREVNPAKQVVWELGPQDLDFPLFTVQEAERLANGNTIVNSWVSTHDLPKDAWSSTVQVFEVTPDKKVVWKLRAWKDPNLGPASSTQILDEPGVPEAPGAQQR
jgi:hypothetical protein